MVTSATGGYLLISIIVWINFLGYVWYSNIRKGNLCSNILCLMSVLSSKRSQIKDAFQRKINKLSCYANWQIYYNFVIQTNKHRVYSSESTNLQINMWLPDYMKGNLPPTFPACQKPCRTISKKQTRHG